MGEYFIIESLGWKDEKENRFEGKFVFDYLKLLGRKPEYFYIRTKKELIEISKKFNSTYSYLYLSCHGLESEYETNEENKGKGIKLTLEPVSYKLFSDIFAGKLNGKRCFVSACWGGTKKFAKEMFRTNEDMRTFLATHNRAEFRATYIFWPTLNYFINKIDEDANARLVPSKIIDFLSQCAPIYADLQLRLYYKRRGKIEHFFIPEDLDEEIE